MEYTIQALAKLAGITTRTLRYYDQIRLLTPHHYTEGGYRIYQDREVDTLQQILFYRELGMPLITIKEIISSVSFNRLDALEQHLMQLKERKKTLNLLIANVKKTIETEKGFRTMNHKEKFEGFKKSMIQENEAAYGNEIRERFGEDTIEKSKAAMMELTEEQYREMQAIDCRIRALLEQAVADACETDSSVGQEIAALHKKWLSFTWSSYTLEAHRSLVQMYVCDSRFTSYYDKNQNGCAAFLCAAVLHFTADESMNL